PTTDDRRPKVITNYELRITNYGGQLITDNWSKATRNTADQVRIWVLIATVLVVGALVLFYAWQFGTKLDWAYIFQHFFDSALVQGAQVTIFLSVVAQTAGITLGLLAALMKLSSSPVAIVNIVLRSIANF